MEPVIISTPPKKNVGRILLISILLGVVGCCIVICIYYQIDIKPIQKTGCNFLDALQQNNYALAYGMMDVTHQAQMVNADGLQSFIESSGLEFSSYSVDYILRYSGNPTRGVMLADLTLINGLRLTIQINMIVGPDNKWQVTDIFIPI